MRQLCVPIALADRGFRSLDRSIKRYFSAKPLHSRRFNDRDAMSNFDLFSAKRGGTYEPSDMNGTLHDKFASTLEGLRQQIPTILQDTAQRNRNLTVDVGFLANIKPGASVQITGNAACIGLSVGLLISIRRIIDATLTHSNGSVPLLPVCKNGPVLLSHQINNVSYLIAGIDDRQGLCNDSIITADFIFDLSVSYIFSHELRHILDGHLDWIDDGRGMSALEDDGVGRTDEVNIFDRRVLEYSADNGAISMLCTNYLVHFVRDNASTESLGFVFWCLMYAVHLTHKIIELNEIGVNPKLSIHPPANIRTHISRLMVMNTIYHSTTIADDLTDYVMTGSASAEKCWHCIFGTVYDADKFIADFGPTEKLISRYNLRWERIRPKLEKHKRIETIPSRKLSSSPSGIIAPSETRARLPINDPRLLIAN